MAKQTFTSGQVLTAQQMNDLQTNDFNQTVSTKTAAYTFVVGDRGTRVVLNDTTARTFTIDNSIFSAGDTIYVHNINTGVLTIAAGAGVTLNGADVLTLTQWQSGTIYFTSASSAIFFPTAKTVSSAVVQVKSTAKTDSFTVNSTSYTDVTGLSVAITPTSASNKVLIVAQLCVGTQNGANMGCFRITGGNATNYVGDAAGSRDRGVFGSFIGVDLKDATWGLSIMYLDSPATTSATTYQVQVKANTNSGSSSIYFNRSAQDADNDRYVRGASSITAMEVTP